MNNNSTLFYEYTLTGKIEINDINNISFDFDSYYDVFKNLDTLNLKVSDEIVQYIIDFAKI